MKNADRAQMLLARDRAELRQRVAELEEEKNKRKQVEEALQQAEEKLRSVVGNIPDNIMTLDRDGTLLYINHTVPGLRVEEVIGTSVYDYVPAENRETLKTAFENVLRTGESTSYETQGIGPNGQISWYESRVGPIYQEEEVVALTLIARDITERKRTEEEIRQQNQMLTVLNAITAAVSSSLELSEIVTTLKNLLSEQFDIPGGAIFFYERAGDCLSMETGWGLPQTILDALDKCPVNGFHGEKVIRNKVPFSRRTSSDWRRFQLWGRTRTGRNGRAACAFLS